MKILRFEVENFGSYKHLEFDFTPTSGLNLIYGPTGSGKSTFCDAVSWCVFGITAKNGGVDDVRPWQETETPTTGKIFIGSRDGKVVAIFRARGGAGKNDLYWTIDGGESQRGKDLADTQSRIEAILDISADTFLAATYIHESSPHTTFFYSSTKAKRELLEQVAALDYPKLLAVRASEKRSDLKKQLTSIELTLSHTEGQWTQAKESLKDASSGIIQWHKDHQTKLEKLATRAGVFEANRAIQLAQLEQAKAQWLLTYDKELSTAWAEVTSLEQKLNEIGDIDSEIRQQTDQSRCTHCKSLPLSANSAIMALQKKKTEHGYNVKFYEQAKARLAKLEAALNPFEKQIQDKRVETNTWLNVVEQVRAEENPFIPQVKKFEVEVKYLEAARNIHLEQKREKELLVVSLTRLYELSFELRGQLLQRAVSHIQESTNLYLEKYFDAELRIELELPSSDTLEVNITKGGYACVFKQLSKGQRQLLKLCFGIAVMDQVSNQCNNAPDIAMLDESLDGLDETMKLKAFGLFSELATKRQSVFFIDHSPGLQNMMDQKYRVEMVGDHSEFLAENS